MFRELFSGSTTSVNDLQEQQHQKKETFVTWNVKKQSDLLKKKWNMMTYRNTRDLFAFSVTFVLGKVLRAGQCSLDLFLSVHFSFFMSAFRSSPVRSNVFGNRYKSSFVAALQQHVYCLNLQQKKKFVKSTFLNWKQRETEMGTLIFCIQSA